MAIKNSNEEIEDVRMVKSMIHSYSIQLWYPQFAYLAIKPPFVHVWFGLF